MSFAIDTGATTRTAADFAPDWLLDQLPADAPRSLIISATVDAAMADLRKYRSAAGVRGSLLRRVPFLQALAAEQPEQFDAIILEYADRITTVS